MIRWFIVFGCALLLAAGLAQAQGAPETSLANGANVANVASAIMAAPAASSAAAASAPLDEPVEIVTTAGRSANARIAPHQPGQSTGIDLRLPQSGKGQGTDTALAVRIVMGLTVLAVLPAIIVCVTAFLRIIIVLSMLRHAIGMPETPPNTVLIGLALFLTLFTMSPVLQELNEHALQPFMQGQLAADAGVERAIRPLREFMVRQTREQDLALMVELSKAKAPQSMDDISNVQLVPAFMLSELRAAFQIGFVIFLPFLLIDLIVSSILMALGMMMMPPTTIALPLKVLMFILVDGWSLILKALVGSFH
ncbi:flagellar biosynthetic protein FliP [Roseateles sp. YR242]|uniref:flagellar type III secretion system pore protein FliP n=1 Tax=Roseateles sp. YR242 TaxID=1855305 RepID=UPI0008C9389E|nr:flagellar type III secretion system pore protein FliP [Roseateles sp. YR242]SEK92825.1 flagellar biosynthetic protein FliP [Roseateles sp. YR242]